MKKTIIIGLLACCVLLLPDSVMAQRYLPRMGGITVNGGVTEKTGFYVEAGYSLYTKRKHHWNFGVNYLMNQDRYYTQKLPLVQVTAQGGYYLRLLQDRRRTFYLSLGVDAVIGHEWVNWGRYVLSDGGRIQDRNRFVFGGALGLEAEYYINDTYVILLRIREKCLANSDVGLWHTEAGLGLKFIIK